MRRVLSFALTGAALLFSVDARGATILVNDDAAPGGDGQTWATAYRYLQDALEAARASAGAVTDIWIAEGVYKPDQGEHQIPGDRAASFSVHAGLHLYGGFAGHEDPITFDPALRNLAQNVTVLDGDLLGNDSGPVSTSTASRADNSLVVVSCAGPVNPVVLDGLTITGGNGANPGFPWLNGSGVNGGDATVVMRYCTLTRNSALSGGAFYSPIPQQNIAHCTFHDNYAAVDGGAAIVQGSISDTVFSNNVAQQAAGLKLTGSTVTRCSFENNQAYDAAGAVECNGPCSFIDCTLVNNQAQLRGGGIHCNGPTLVKGCNFNRNISILWGAAIYADAGATLTLHDSRFVNHPSAVIMLATPQAMRVQGCVFTGARRVLIDGLGEAINASQWTFTNCLFAGATRGVQAVPLLTRFENCSFSKVGGPDQQAIVLEGAALEVVNCILADGGNEIGNTSGGSISVAYSLVQGGWAGVGNISGDPLYAQLPSDGGNGWGDEVATNGVDEGANDNGGDLRLRQGSPCIESGDKSALSPDMDDLDQDGDTSEPIPLDLAKKTRAVDDPSAPDSGVGPPPMVDMGAYEYQDPPLIIAAFSERTHTGGGLFAIDLLHPLAGAASACECRQGGPRQLTLTFDRPVACSGGCDPSDVRLNAGTVTAVTSNGTTVQVSLVGVPNRTCLQVSFPGLVDAAQPAIDVYETLKLAVQLGDGTGNCSTDIFDMVQMRNVINHVTSAGNYRFDLNLDGLINIFDMVVARNNRNTSTTCP